MASVVCGLLLICSTWVARRFVSEREIAHATSLQPWVARVLYANTGLLVVICALFPDNAFSVVVFWVLALIVWISSCELVLRRTDKTQEEQFNEDDPRWLEVAKNIKRSGDE